jgi:hypothetical protein
MKIDDKELEAMARKYCELMGENTEAVLDSAKKTIRHGLALWEATREYRAKQDMPFLHN